MIELSHWSNRRHSHIWANSILLSVISRHSYYPHSMRIHRSHMWSHLINVCCHSLVGGCWNFDAFKFYDVIKCEDNDLSVKVFGIRVSTRCAMKWNHNAFTYKQSNQMVIYNWWYFVYINKYKFRKWSLKIHRKTIW